MQSIDEPIRNAKTQCRLRHHRVADVFLIGAAKAATTTLANWLARHPRVSFGQAKESNFFSHEFAFSRGFDWYSAIFDTVSEDQLALDASTGYTRLPQNPGVAERIREASPNARLIYLMRHPIDRAFSHYVHRWTKECHRGKPFTVPFEEYIKDDPMCVDSSDYRQQVLAYLDVFEEKALLCLFTEDMLTRPQQMMRDVFRFLELDITEDVLPEQIVKMNESNEYLESRVRVAITDRIKSMPLLKRLLPLVPRPAREQLYSLLRQSRIGNRTLATMTPIPLDDSVRSQLIDRFADSNAWVSEFTGRDLSHWNT